MVIDCVFLLAKRGLTRRATRTSTFIELFMETPPAQFEPQFIPVGRYAGWAVAVREIGIASRYLCTVRDLQPGSAESEFRRSGPRRGLPLPLPELLVAIILEVNAA